MKSIIIKIVIFAAGVGVGVFSAKKYYENLVEEEIESIREHLGKHLKPESVDDIKDSLGIVSPSKAMMDAVRSNPNPLTRSSLDGNPYEQAKKNYDIAGKRALLNPVDEAANSFDEDDDPDEEDEEVTDAAGKTEEDMDLSKVDRTQPYVIDDREFCEEFDHHNKISLYYYRGDEVLCEENEEVITDAAGTVGNDALTALETQGSVWVRNEPLAIDYEIIALNKAYSDTVMPSNLSPREAHILQQNKRDLANREK